MLLFNLAHEGKCVNWMKTRHTPLRDCGRILQAHWGAGRAGRAGGQGALCFNHPSLSALLSRLCQLAIFSLNLCPQRPEKELDLD